MPNQHHSGAIISDWRAVRTGDGSFSLDSAALGEHYHSLHGALTESRHVYVEHGFRSLYQERIDLLEIGFGTGLNALLAWQESDARKMEVNYLAIEPDPVPEDLWSTLGHTTAIGAPEMETGYRQMMRAVAGENYQVSGYFNFRTTMKRVQELDAINAFDLVFHDAFAPRIQPEMWTLNVFITLFRAMRPGAILVTYCAKGEVRRTMLAAGFRVERLPGPPGKHEMLRAQKT
jgi:tRNA U34 5-methylaminomethyl-2-thiouridine-forming methyltransferase MnmC